MAGKHRALANTPPAFGALRIQTSMYGLALPAGYGRNRLTGNLLWYGGFQAIRQEERSEAGKGGRSLPSRVYFVYIADVMMGLLDGPIYAIHRVWRGKKLYEGAEVQKTREYLHGGGAVLLDEDNFTAELENPCDGLVSVMQIHRTDVGDHAVGLTENVHFARSGNTLTFSLSGTYLVEIRYFEVLSTAIEPALANLGLGLRTGLAGQAVWSHLQSSYPTEALAYNGISYVYGQNYALTDSAEVENHSFECDMSLRFSDSIPDANPAAVVRDIAVNPQYGVTVPATLIDADQYSDYCVANDLFVSPVYAAQRPARECIEEMLQATNSDAAWTGRHLKLIPRGTEAATANGATYTPTNTPIWDLTIDDFVVVSGEQPIRVERIEQGEIPNIIRAEFCNRANAYNVEPITAMDEDSVLLHGKRPEQSVHNWHFFCEATLARKAVELRKQKLRAIRNRYSFKLPFRFAQAEPGDIVTLTYASPTLNLNLVPVMITKVKEAGNNRFEIEAEDFPVGHTTAPVIAPQIGSGFASNHNAAPGSVLPPMFFELPGGFTETGLEIAVAVQSADPMWGGCDAYASLDNGDTYKQIATINQGARYGNLHQTLGMSDGAILQVNLLGHRPGKLHAVSQSNLDALQTLCYVGSPDQGEYLAFRDAIPIAAKRYELSTLIRGAYGTTPGLHPFGSQFVYLDDSLGTSGPLDKNLIGKTVKFKFLSFNVYGGGAQSLDQVPEYAYTITGRFADQRDRPVPLNDWVNSDFQFDVRDWSWFGDGPNPVLFDIAAPAYRMAGVPSNAVLIQQGNNAGQNCFAGGKRMTARPNQRHFAAAGLIPMGKAARIDMVFLDAAGNILGAPISSNTIEALPAGQATQNPDVYREAFLDGVSPPGTASRLCSLVLIGQEDAVQDPLCYITRPASGEYGAADRGRPAYTSGPQGTVDANQLQPESAHRVVRASIPVHAVLSATSGPNPAIELAIPAVPDGEKIKITVSGIVSVSGSANFCLGRLQPIVNISQVTRPATGYLHVLDTTDGVTSGKNFSFVLSDFAPKSVGSNVAVYFAAGNGGSVTLTDLQLLVEIVRR